MHPEPANVFESRLVLTRRIRPEEPFWPLEKGRYTLERREGSPVEVAFSARALEDVLSTLSSGDLSEEQSALLGDHLRSFLGDAWRLEEAALKEARAAGRPVHLQIVTKAHELLALPWELLRLSGESSSLALDPNLVTCYELPETQSAPRRGSPPLEGGRILFAWAGGQEGLRDLSVPHAEHHAALLQLGRDAHGSPYSAADELPQATLESLSHRLAQAHAGPQPYTVLHLLCHGVALEPGNPSSAWGILLWSAEHRCLVASSPAQLAEALRPSAGVLEAVVLCVCKSAGAAVVPSRLGSVALALHQLGIPAVIGARSFLSKRGSLQFTEAFYRSLLVSTASRRRLCSLEEAFTRARAALASAPGPALGGMLELRPAMADAAALQLYKRRADGLDLRPFQIKPYRGLAPFEAHHHPFYFGREQEVAALVQQVEALLSPSERLRLLLVSGWSGAGKSSLIQAGLIPALKARGPWEVVELSPSGPRRRLKRAPGVRSTGQRGVPLPDGDEALQAVPFLQSLLTRPSSLPRLVVVDALEEAFSPRLAASLQGLGQAIGALATEPTLQTVVVCTLRIDFVDALRSLPLDAARGLRASQLAFAPEHWFSVGELDPAQLRTLIEAPAQAVGLGLEPGLTDRLLDFLRDAPEALPLLEHALEQLWHRRQGPLLVASGLGQAEGLAGVLQQTASACLDALQSQDGGEGNGPRLRQLRRVFLALVDARGDLRWATRRRVSLSELQCSQAQDQEALEDVLETLQERRLLIRLGRSARPGNDDPAEEAASPVDATRSSGSPERALEVMLVHEILVRTWAPLQRWLEEDALLNPLREDLREEAPAWDLAGRPVSSAYLRLRGERLQQAERECQRGVLLPSPLEALYLQHCRALEDDEQARENERRITHQQLRRVSVAAAVLVILALIFSTVAFHGQRRAFGLEQQASSSYWLEWARAQAAHSPLNTVLGLLQVERVDLLEDWQPLAFEALGQAVPFERWETGLELTGAEVSPDGARALLLTAAGGIVLWKRTGPMQTLVPPTEVVPEPHCDTRAQFSPDGQWHVTVSRVGLVQLWGGDTPVSLPTRGGCPEQVVFSSDSALLTVRSAEGHLWSCLTRSPLTGTDWQLPPEERATALLAVGSGRQLLVGTQTSEQAGRILTIAHPPCGSSQPSGCLEEITRTEAPVVALAHAQSVLAAGLESGQITLRRLVLEGALQPPVAGPDWPERIDLRVDRVVGEPPAQDTAQGGSDLGRGPEDIGMLLPLRLQLSPDGQALAVLPGSGEAQLRLRRDPGTALPLALDDGDVHDGNVHDGNAHDGDVHYGVQQVGFSPDGAQILIQLAAGDPFLARAGEVRSPARWTRLGDPTGQAVASHLGEGSTGRWAFRAGHSGVLTFWAAAGALPEREARHLGNGLVLAQGSEQGQAFLLQDARGGRVHWPLSGRSVVLEGFPSSPDAVALSPQGDHVAVLGQGQLWRWTPDVAAEAVPSSVLSLDAQSIQFSPDGGSLAVGMRDGRVSLLDAGSSALRADLSIGAEGIAALAFSPDGGRLAVGTGSGHVCVAPLRGTPLALEACAPASEGPPAEQQALSLLRFSPDGQWLLAASARSGWVTLWAEGGMGARQRLAEASLAVDPGASPFSADSRLLALSNPAARAVHWWHLENHDTVLSPTTLDLAKALPDIRLGSLDPVRPSARGEALLISSQEGHFLLVEPAAGGALRLFAQGQVGSQVLSEGFTLDERRFWTLTQEGVLQHWRWKLPDLQAALACITRACVSVPRQSGLRLRLPERACPDQAARGNEWPQVPDCTRVSGDLEPKPDP